MPQARNKPRRSQPAAAEASSALLQFLEKLDEDTFQQTLLPMLIKAGSAGNIAATCTQLRKLCHSFVKKLNLRQLLSDNTQPSAAEQWTQHLQEHFPHCDSVLLRVDEQDSYLAISYMLPALARLPDLRAMNLDVEGPQALDVLPMAMLLLSIRTQLTRPLGLTLGLSQRWTGAHSAWGELAGLTQLTSLHIESSNAEGGQCRKRDLLQLSRLCGLQELSVDIECETEAEHPVCFQIASQMSSLTSLKLNACSADGFQSLSSCANLQSLSVIDQAGVAFELSATDWKVVGQLTQLTYLVLWPVTPPADCEACPLALQQLTGLKSLSTAAWAPVVLELLHGLPHLTTLGGDFLPSDSSDIDFAFERVTQIRACSGCLPCSAFPNLLHVELFEVIPSSVLAAFSRHCCHMQSLLNLSLPGKPANANPTLDGSEPGADRVAAVRSLASLHHLTALHFCMTDDAEMHAVCQAAAVLAVHKLAELRLVVHSTSGVSSGGLFAVAQVSSIKLLGLFVLKPTLLHRADLAQNFVAVLSGVKTLELVVASEEQHTRLTGAFAHVELLGLPLPSQHSVSVVS